MKLINKVLLANDFSKSSENVVLTAIEFARIFHSEIIPIHVLPDDMVIAKARALLEEAAVKKLDETVDLIKKEGVDAGAPLLKFGVPNEQIVQATADTNASFILTGSGETEKDDKFLLGTTAKRIIQKSEKPVLVVKEGVPFNVRHILCPVDLSDTSKRALKNAITMAHRFKAELTILCVCEVQGSAWFTSADDMAMENANRCKDLKVKFEEFVQEFNLAGITWNKELRRGYPAEEILQAVSDKKVDLLVMGTTGKTGLNRLLIGSVAEKVVREVPCSFLTLKSEDLVTLQLETDIRDIENHYSTAVQLMEDGFYKESIDQFQLCLSISNMHVPSHFGIAKVYDKLNQPEKANMYRNSGREVLDRIWYTKIEEEVRKFRSH